jgi:putative salt-induced outer membrane protein
MKIILILCCLLTSLAHAQLTNESEVSTVATGGNTQTESYLFKTTNTLTQGSHKYSFGGHYTYSEADQNVNVRSWDLNTKYEQFISSRAAIFIGEVVESYRFQGIKARYNADIGAKYYYIRSDNRNLFSELGYRYTIEDRYSPEENQYSNKIRFYNEFFEKKGDSLQYRFWVEFVPNLSQTSDYLVTFEASMTTILTSMFSLKISYKGIYDAVPAFEKNREYDYTYSTALVAKF